MYVYFIKVFTDPQMIKIGKSKNPEKRLKAMQTGCTQEMLLMAKIRCKSEAHALQVEKMVHHKYKRYRADGEWFTYHDGIIRRALVWQNLSGVLHA